MKSKARTLMQMAKLVCAMLILAVGTTASGQEKNFMMLKDAGEGHGLLFSGEARKQAGVPEEIAQYIWDMQDQLSDWRQGLHKIPELGHKEVETHDYIMQALTQMGYKPKPIGPSTGIILDIPGADISFTIGVRADFDALPIPEANDGRPYRSTKEGFSHACGHDVHTTIILGIAKAYADKKAEPPCNIRLIFQPAEEPGTGALEMIKAGVLKKVDIITGLHAVPYLEWGTIELTSSVWSAFATYFQIEITGQPSHGGAFVHEGKDAIVTAAYLINELQSIASRNVAAADAGVVSIGTIQGGNSPNQVADKVVMAGTTRAESQAIHDMLKKRITAIINGTSMAMDMPIKVDWIVDGPGTVNNKAMFEVTKETSKRILGDNNVFVLTKPMMGGEDFSYYTQKIPGFFFSLGVGNNKKGITAGLHTPEFDIDERALVVGTALQLSNVKALYDYHKSGGKF